MAGEVSKELQDLYKSVAELSKSYKSLSSAEFVRSGSVVFDALLGGGIPKGVFILWSAENGCGKSTGALHISWSYCVQGKRVLYLDYEGGVNISQIKGIGLDQYLYNKETNPTGQFILFQCQTYKDGEKILDKLMSTVDLVVIDSMTAILTEKVKGSSSEDVLPGIDARVCGTFMKKYKAEAVRQGVTWLMINQIRTKIAIGFGQVTHDDESGGQALKFFPDIRLRMKRAYQGSLEREELTSNGKKKVPFGAICDIWAVKNRYERPNIPLKLAVLFGQGLSNEYAYYDFLENEGVIKKSGAWYEVKFGDFNEKLNGMSRVIEFITNNKQQVKDYINSKGGYRLLLNEDKAISLNGEGGEEGVGEVYDKSVLEDFDNISEPSENTEDEYVGDGED